MTATTEAPRAWHAARITVEELFAFTEEERNKWERWAGALRTDGRSGEPARRALELLGELAAHIFETETAYVRLLYTLPDEGRRAERRDLGELFAFGREGRETMRVVVRSARRVDWERGYEFQTISRPVRVSMRKIVLHVLFHEIRHWAQLARSVRELGLTPPGEHDLLFSACLE